MRLELTRSTKNEQRSDPIKKRLDVIIRLLLEQQINEKITKSKAVGILDSLDLNSTEIGTILGMAASNVRTEIAKLRKLRKKSSGKKQDMNVKESTEGLTDDTTISSG